MATQLYVNNAHLDHPQANQAYTQTVGNGPRSITTAKYDIVGTHSNKREKMERDREREGEV